MSRFPPRVQLKTGADLVCKTWSSLVSAVRWTRFRNVPSCETVEITFLYFGCVRNVECILWVFDWMGSSERFKKKTKDKFVSVLSIAAEMF